ncbi:MAG: transglutaminase family protein [Methylocystis sp.]|nr:transglutaminase family protein [Methylocystis sp.]MCA3582195.1 transglutaminase family protein [Methylocystis sp.]MCA3587913.1 transglutaminase family protein [Methylocystis sp.]MCA3590256.1 transglutaminase family protein [Methylocystis sp.]
MLYDVTLRMSYRFGDHPASGRQILRVLPRAVPGRQRVIASALDFHPRPVERSDGSDFFGNITVEAVFRDVWRETAFTVAARVERTVETAGLDFSPAIESLPAAIDRQRDLGPRSPHHFMGPSVRIEPDAAISRYARDQLLPRMTACEAASALNMALYRDMAFDAEATDVDTPAAAAFALRSGVCQDFAHIMITALRSVGIPAGYVSGLLSTRPPEGKPRLEGADAMHAWVMAWCGEEAGWQEFDPTNGIIVANEHILIAIGRDYADAAPVSGVLKTTGSQEIDQAVDVIPL